VTASQYLPFITDATVEDGFCWYNIETPTLTTTVIDTTPPGTNFHYDEVAHTGLLYDARAEIEEAPETAEEDDYWISEAALVDAQAELDDLLLEQSDLAKEESALKLEEDATRLKRSILNQKLTEHLAIRESRQVTWGGCENSLCWNQVRNTYETEIEALESRLAEINNTDLPSIEGQITAKELAITEADSSILTLANQIASQEAALGVLKLNLDTVKSRATNQPVELLTHCVDEGAGCLLQNELLGIESIDSPAEIQGNFCAEKKRGKGADNVKICDEKGVREFSICDLVGNCGAGHLANIDWYDIQYPEDNTSQFRIPGVANTIAASDRVIFEITSTDPDYKKQESDDENACGSNAASPFFEDKIKGQSLCYEKVRACAPNATSRGFVDVTLRETCDVGCGDGYYLLGDYCEPVCDYRTFDGCFPFEIQL